MAKNVKIRYQSGFVSGPIAPQDFQRLTIKDVIGVLNKLGENLKFEEIILSERNSPNWREIRRVTGNTRAKIFATRAGNTITVWRNDRIAWIHAKHALASLFPSLLRGETEFITM